MASIIKCEYCGKTFNCSSSRYKKSKHHFCSKNCMNNWYKEDRESNPDYLNCTCVICGKKFHLKPYQLNKYPTHTCSKECTKEAQKRRMTGKNNHQYGIRGKDNAKWNGEERISSYGYKLIYMPNHPFCNGDNMVFEHRLVAEKYLLTDENSVEINGERYLRKDYVVHHKDENRLNNDVSNLQVMTKGEHTKYHNKSNIRERDELGRFKSA